MAELRKWAARAANISVKEVRGKTYRILQPGQRQSASRPPRNTWRRPWHRRPALTFAQQLGIPSPEELIARDEDAA